MGVFALPLNGLAVLPENNRGLEIFLLARTLPRV